jgi:hypothetical protein
VAALTCKKLANLKGPGESMLPVYMVTAHHATKGLQLPRMLLLLSVSPTMQPATLSHSTYCQLTQLHVKSKRRLHSPDVHTALWCCSHNHATNTTSSVLWGMLLTKLLTCVVKAKAAEAQLFSQVVCNGWEVESVLV